MPIGLKFDGTDEREEYAAKLNKAGIKVTAIRHLGTIHEFVMMITDTPAAWNAIATANAHLQQVFSAIEQKTTTAESPAARSRC